MVEEYIQFLPPQHLIVLGGAKCLVGSVEISLKL